MEDFYPRSPRGERQGKGTVEGSQVADFYPRSPRGERRSTLQRTNASCTFLSTLPARGATCVFLLGALICEISIHAPREGSDDPQSRKGTRGLYFYPRSPRGERHIASFLKLSQGAFLSTLPARGATTLASPNTQALSFLSTLPARGATI